MYKITNYKLEFKPNIKSFTFHCNETIILELFSKSQTIELDAIDLKISQCKLYFKNKLIDTKLVVLENKLLIKFTQIISGLVKLFIEYSGNINDKLIGFYRSHYVVSGKKKFLATTQLEATYARRLFPCYDNPNMKSTFDVSILVDPKLTALSNMPLQFKKQIKNKILFKFQTTLPMSTYLLYIGIGKFEFLTGYYKKTLIRIVTTENNSSKGKFALKLTKKFLMYYSNYFGIEYELPKLDLIAIPDFAAGAMENWGAITFRESYLLYDEKKSTIKTKQTIAEIISHELVHQWFGNLVTMKWWNDLWLNESFATFLSIKAVQHFFPHWHYQEQFLEKSMNSSMKLDSLNSTHPIDVKVLKPNEINEIFDEISYEKGCCILRMLEYYIGENNLKMCLHEYIKNNIYKNATGEDLWQSIDDTLHQNIKKIMTKWIKQKGFPILTIKINKNLLMLSQKHFSLDESHANKTLWKIPVFVGINRNQTYLLTTKTKKIKINDASLPIINSSRSVFMRINYHKGILSTLISLIKSSKLNNIDRWMIQNDFFALCLSRRIKIQDYLELLTVAYYNENDYLVLNDIINNLKFLYLLSYHEIFSVTLKRYLLNNLNKIYDKLNWNKHNTHLDVLLRNSVFIMLGKLGYAPVIKRSKTMFQYYTKNQKINPDLSEIVFTLAAWHGDSKIHEIIVLLHNKAETQEEKIIFLIALCNFQDPSLLIQTLNFSLTSHVRSQNMHVPIVNMVNNPCAKKIIWPWIRDNWGNLTMKIGVDNLILNRIISCLSILSDLEILKDMKLFFKKQKIDSGIDMTLKQIFETMKINNNFIKSLPL